MSMHDYLLQFRNEAEATSDPVMLARYYRPPSGTGAMTVPGGWAGDKVLAGVQLWDPANDTVSQVPGIDGIPIDVVTHEYLQGYWVIIAEPQQKPDLDSHPDLMILAERDSKVIVTDNMAATYPDWKKFVMAPAIFGMEYPFLS